MCVHGGNLLMFLTLLFSVNCDFGRVTNIWEGYSDLRQAVGVLSTRVQALVSCAITCSLLGENCYALNYNETCEVLGVPEGSPVLQRPDAAAGWTFYLRSDFVQSPCSFPVCKTGSICLPFPDRYEPDNYDEPPSLWPRYTCSSHSYLVNKQQAGNPNCRFEQLVNSSVYGYDISPYDPGHESYATVLSHCDTAVGSPCLSLESRQDGGQFLKTEHHLSNPNLSLREVTSAAFFFADCYP